MAQRWNRIGKRMWQYPHTLPEPEFSSTRPLCFRISINPTLLEQVTKSLGAVKTTVSRSMPIQDDPHVLRSQRIFLPAVPNPDAMRRQLGIDFEACRDRLVQTGRMRRSFPSTPNTEPNPYWQAIEELRQHIEGGRISLTPTAEVFQQMQRNMEEAFRVSERELLSYELHSYSTVGDAERQMHDSMLNTVSRTMWRHNQKPLDELLQELADICGRNCREIGDRSRFGELLLLLTGSGDAKAKLISNRLGEAFSQSGMTMVTASAYRKVMAEIDELTED